MDQYTRADMLPLLDLQKIDSAIDRLRDRRANLPEQRELDEVAERREGISIEHAERSAELDAVVREQTKFETEITQVSDKIEHEQGRLYSGEVNNPKELSSIQAELDALRRRKSHLEDQELEVMERREELEGTVNGLHAQLTEAGSALAEVTARRDAAAVEIERELSGFDAQRAQLAPTIDADLLEMYESMRGKMSGVAVAALQDWTCRGCGLPLSPLARDEIRRSDDALIRCENCRRLLVLV